LGIETIYGRNTGSYRVIDALATLAFDYPRRAPFFRGELREYVQLAHEQRWSPLAPKGSFAGAMGMPQFMPGSYRQFAVDFDGDDAENAPDKLGADPVGLLLLEEAPEDGEPQTSYWIACPNFYVITRYNKSRLYAAAVVALAQAVRQAHDAVR